MRSATSPGSGRGRHVSGSGAVQGAVRGGGAGWRGGVDVGPERGRGWIGDEAASTVNCLWSQFGWRHQLKEAEQGLVTLLNHKHDIAYQVTITFRR